MQRRLRLTRSTDIQRVQRFGKSYAHPLMVLKALASDLPQIRVGVLAGRLVGGAVRRNRAKRLLRAAIRSLLPDITPGWDIILIARKPFSEASMLEIRSAIISLLKNSQLLLKNHDT